MLVHLDGLESNVIISLSLVVARAMFVITVENAFLDCKISMGIHNSFAIVPMQFRPMV